MYLSPHLDDAALSCGGRIAAQVAAGERVLVVTLCTAAPPADSAFSPLAQQFHTEWSLPPEQVVAARLREEQAAMAQLGCDYVWAGLLDAIYRYPQAYESNATLFNTPAPNDPLFADLQRVVSLLRERLPDGVFYAPLGVGSHVDHLITLSVAGDLLGNNVRFYEDLPYAITAGALERQMQSLDTPLSPQTLVIGERAFQTKLEAITAYASQLDILFGGAEAMVRAMTDYARSVNPDGNECAERLWAR
jgi:LmbE family N-acetylglucosaminyl deacetylase